MVKILNANPGFGAPLGEQETIDFLTTGKLNVHLGTVDEKGHSNIHPAWYFYDPLKEMIYIETSKQAKPPYKGVRGKGSVKIHEDIDFNVPIAEKIMVRYLGNLEHPMAQALLDLQRKGQSVVLEISPKYYSTWDYSKQ